VAVTTEWVLLAYRLPREPSTPRIALWRRLRRLGAAQIIDGLVALPRNEQTQEQLEWLAGEVHDAGGEATIWLATHGSGAQQRSLEERMSDTVATEYEAVLEAARAAQAREGASRRRALARLRRTLRVIRARDYFAPPQRTVAEKAVEDLASIVEVAQ
jgi:hypothetical protein